MELAMKKYDLVVIGAGSGGLVSAEIAAKFGAKVALLELMPNLGGECLNAGCVPSKALIKAARTAYAVKNGHKVGIEAVAKVNFAQVMKHVKGSIDVIEKARDNDDHYIEMGVDMYHGKAQFVSPKAIMIDGKEIGFKKCIIATGSRPLIPSISGIEDTSYLTNESIFELNTLPEKLTIIGGGPIAVELGQAFAMLGSKVTLLVREDRLLPREELSAANALQAEFEAMGITIVFGVELKSTAGKTGNITVTYACNGAQSELKSTHLLLAAGRLPNTDLNLDAAGVGLTERGAVMVNDQLQSSQKNIFAVGDCNGGMQFTHVAAEQATIAVQNALFFGRSKNGSQMPVWATFTTPEIAHLGAYEGELQKKGVSFKTHIFAYDDIDRAVAEGEHGFIQVFTAKNDQILGATIVGENAGELTAQLALAVKNKIGFKRLGATLQAYPTYGMGLKEMASRVGLEELSSGIIGKIIRRII